MAENVNGVVTIELTPNPSTEGGAQQGIISVDASLSETSENPVQNKVVTAAINEANDGINELKGDLVDLNNIYNRELFYDTSSIELNVSSQRIKSDCTTEYNATGYSRSGSQEVSVGDTFFFYGKGNTDTAIICGYDAELSPVSCIAYSGDSAEYKLITITNANWKRVVFCSSTVGITPIIIKAKKSLDSIRVGSFQNLLESEKGYELGYYDGTGYVLDSPWWCHKRYDVSAYVGRNYILKYVNGSWSAPRTYFEDAEGNKTMLGLDHGSMRYNYIVTGTIPIDAKYLYHTVNTALWDTHEFLIETNSNAYVDVASKNFVKDSIKDYTLTKRKPCCCFIFDDGNSTDEAIKAIFDSRRLKCGFAPASTIADRYLQYSKEGFSILAHGASLPSPLSESSVSSYLHQRKMVVNMAGIECYGWVTPSSALDAQYQSLVYDHFKYGFTIYKGEDLSNVYIPKTQKSYSLWRSNIDTKTVAQIQAIIDEAITNNAMVVFYSHGEITSENLASVIDYCIGEQIKVLAPDECIEYFFAHRHNEDD